MLCRRCSRCSVHPKGWKKEGQLPIDGQNKTNQKLSKATEQTRATELLCKPTQTVSVFRTVNWWDLKDMWGPRQLRPSHSNSIKTKFYFGQNQVGHFLLSFGSSRFCSWHGTGQNHRTSRGFSTHPFNGPGSCKVAVLLSRIWRRTDNKKTAALGKCPETR